MKIKFKKIICLSLSIFMLNAPVFVQDFHGTINSITAMSEQEILEIEHLINTIEAKYRISLKNIASSNYRLQSAAKEKASVLFSSPYYPESSVYNSFKVYYRDVYELEKDVNNLQKRIYKIYNRHLENFPEGSYIRKVTENYIKERLNPLFEAQTNALNKILSWADLIKEQPKIHDMYKLNKFSHFINESAKYKFYKNMYEKDARLRNAFLEDLVGYQKSAEVLFTWDMENIFKQIKRLDSTFTPEAIAFFSKNEHTLEEILAYFEKRAPEIQRSTLYSLKITDEGVTVKQLLKYLQEYLKKTNKRLLKVKNLPPEVLSTMLTKMTISGRTHFVESLVNFEPEAKVLANEIRQAEKAAGKRLLQRNTAKAISTPVLVIGSFLIFASITEVSAQNTFQEPVLDNIEIQNKLDNGEILSFEEIAYYYTDDANYSEIKKNLNSLPEAWEATTAVNAWLDDLENTIENSKNTDIEKQENAYNIFERYYQDNIEQINSQIKTPSKIK